MIAPSFPSCAGAVGGTQTEGASMSSESLARVREFVRQRELMLGLDAIAVVRASMEDAPAALTLTDLAMVLRLAESASEAYDRGYMEARMNFDESGLP